MHKFSEEEAEQILAESRAILERGRREGRGMADDPPVSDDATVSKNEAMPRISEPPLETRNQRDRRELDEQEARFARG
jgi:hypothetical protein